MMFVSCNLLSKFIYKNTNRYLKQLRPYPKSVVAAPCSFYSRLHSCEIAYGRFHFFSLLPRDPTKPI